MSLQIEKAAGDVLVSWPVVQRAAEYRVDTGASVTGLSPSVSLISNRYGEGMDSQTRFYRAHAVVESTRTTTDHIMVDQFGYSPAARKVAVISNPKAGFNATNAFTPGTLYQVRRISDDVPVYTNTPVAWSNGATHAGSGDQVWWFDFTAVSNAGNYYVYDTSNHVSSYTFRIATNVYSEVLKQAMRTFFYQRFNFAKVPPFAETNWTDATPSHLGPEQDADCRSVTNTSVATSRDLTGGWFDAGDLNKYVNFADKCVHDLLSAYEEKPGVWNDHCQLPESGNGIPDLLDEVKWELDWLLRMQNPDGSVLLKVSSTSYGSGSPPSSDHLPQRYAPATASATISACGVYAHAAIVYKGLSNSTLQSYVGRLEAAATNAWNWLEANPDKIPSSYDNAGFPNGAASSEDWDNTYGAYPQYANRTCAAAYLFKMTGQAKYRTYFDANFRDVHLMMWQWIYSSEVQYQDALLYYTKIPGATASNVADIIQAYRTAARSMLGQYTGQTDAYRAWIKDYYWGCNQAKSDNGNMMWSAVMYGVDSTNDNSYKEAGAAYIHYLHGVNPMGIVYLSNMGRYGAEKSVPEFYHSWFNDGTRWDNVETSLGPAPGYVVGGPNPGFAPDLQYSGPPLVPPQNQPDQKSYRSWNTGWPEDSWQITENGIYYQSAYVKLLSKLL